MTDETATFSRTIPPTYNPLQVAADLTFSEVSVLSNLRVWIPLSLFAILSFAPKASYAQQSPPPPTPSHTQLPTPDTGDETANNMSAEMAKKAAKERAKAIKNDTDKLLKLSMELKESVDKSDENVLSLDVIKKAEEIEKLAKSVRAKMKGPN